MFSERIILLLFHIVYVRRLLLGHLLSMLPLSDCHTEGRGSEASARQPVTIFRSLLLPHFLPLSTREIHISTVQQTFEKNKGFRGGTANVHVQG